MVIYLPLLVAVVGLLIYVLSNHPKIPEIGRAMFWCGLLVFLLTFAGHAVSLH